MRRLVEWQPPLGVLSLYLKFDPGDRSGAWRTELRNGLAEVLEGDRGRDHETLVALRATGERISERFANHDADLPRGEVGFVEVSAKPGREEWRSSAVAPDVSLPVAFGERPLVAPLMSMLARGAPRGVALLSGERVRLLQWAPRRLDELHAWELSVFSLDWRERKAATVADPSRGQAVSTSGHDRFDARLRENRHRFLGECGKLARLVAPVRAWGELVLFGSAEERREFERGFGTGEGIELSCGADADLVSEPADRVEQAIEAAAARLDAARELHLVERALGESQGGVRGALGPDEVQAALAESRVESLVIDAARAAECEPMVKTALESGASVATILGEAADRLAPCGGSAAVLRY
ncbi:MAG TPA: VLRF1 family aeRF1-type release factor [Solirubrobacterales bacterium]|nr:VLRF1 family aeRF1-type release factor [Solirubrobacterales bacterium]